MLVVFISAHLRKVVTSGVVEQVGKIGIHSVRGGYFARTQSAVHFDLRAFDLGSAFFGGDTVLFKAVFYHFVAAEQFGYFFGGTVSQRPEQQGNGDLALTVHADRQSVGGILNELQPRAARRDHRRFVTQRAVFVGNSLGGVYAGAPDKLADDDAFRAVDDERAVLGHSGEFSHKDFGFFDDSGVFDCQSDLDAKRHGIGSVMIFALFCGVFAFAGKRVLQKLQLDLVAVVGDRRKVVQDFPDAFVDKRIVGVFLDFNKIGNVYDFFYFAKRPSFDIPTLDLVDSFRHLIRSL